MPEFVVIAASVLVFAGIAGACFIGAMASLTPKTVAVNIAQTRGIERLAWRAARYLQ